MTLNKNLREIKVKICSCVFAMFKQNIQQGNGTLEAGGILIGKENISDGNIVIKYSTEPYSNDERGYKRFKRKDKKHIDFYQSIFNSSNKIYGYIGEWHTHDEEIPNFSSIDLKNWQKIAKKPSIIKEYFHIIVGYKAIRIWKYGNLSEYPNLIETISWKDVIEID